MTDIVQRLREKWPWITDWEEVDRQRAEAANEIETLRRFIREIYEVYAGSEGLPEPIYASEAYLFHLIKQMVKIASEALSYKQESNDNNEIEKLREIVQFIANDPLELSHDKIKLQRDDWRKRCYKTSNEI